MTSSDPVFTRKNPFQSELHLPKSHYNPSRAKKIPKEQKKLALSPVRYTQRSSLPDSSFCNTSLHPQNHQDSHHVVTLGPPPAAKGHQNFLESWPSTDQSSSPTIMDASQPEPIVTSGTQEPSVLAKYIERFRYGRPQSRSERQSLVADTFDDQQFWWLSSSPQLSSSTPTPTSIESLKGQFDCKNVDLFDKHRPNTSLSPTRGLLDLSVLEPSSSSLNLVQALSDSSHCEPAESDILQLQERASRLLQKSEHSVSTGSNSVPVSSEGLGSDFSLPVSVDEPIRRPIVSSLVDAANLLARPSMSGEDPTIAPSALSSVCSRPRPEDDILFQWRLRRKMEQARQGNRTSTYSSALHQPLLNRLTLQPELSFTSAPIEVTGNHASRPAFEPVLPVSTTVHSESCTQTEDDLITSNHLVCLPFSNRATGTREPQSPCSLTQPHQDKLLGNLTEQCRKQQCLSAQSTPPSESPSEQWHGKQQRGDHDQGKGSIELEKKEKKAGPASRKQKSDSTYPTQAELHPGWMPVHLRALQKLLLQRLLGDNPLVRPPSRQTRSIRYARDDEVAKRNHNTAKVKDRNAKCQERVKAKESSKENTTQRVGQSSTRRASPPSPIHNTLGQVVSEVLFPGEDLQVQLQTPCSVSSPINTPPEPSQSPVPLPQSYVSQPCEVIGQLMQEAEDSDGLEFEDDPLLVVLRQQRQWVKEQLCEVDMMLDKLHMN